jgi:hypothetical protein
MCHVLVVLEGRSKDPENKEKQKSLTTTIKKRHKSPIIIFINLGDKNAQKTLESYQKKHPSAIKWPQSKTITA